MEVKRLREEEDRLRLLAEDEKARKFAEIEPNKEVETEISDGKVTEITNTDGEQLIISQEEVANVQQAKDYLKKKYPELTARQISNKANIIEIANEKGIKFEAIQE